ARAHRHMLGYPVQDLAIPEHVPGPIERLGLPGELTPGRVSMRRLDVAHPSRLGELSGADLLSHLARLPAYERPVLELPPRQLRLTGPLHDLLAAAAADRVLDELVLDAVLVERLLDPPARVRADLHPLIAAAMELHGHGGPLRSTCP